MTKVVDLLHVLREYGRENFVLTSPDLKHDEYDLEVVLDEVSCTTENDPKFENPKESKDNAQLVFTSIYDNRTKTEQEHKFTAQRSTVATATMKMTEGFIKGFDVGFSIKVPQPVAKATSAFGHEMTIKSETTHIVQKELVWTIDTPVRVPGEKRAIAKLEVKEDQYECEFKGWVVLQGKVKIRVSKDGVYVKTTQNPIGTILKDVLPKYDITTEKIGDNNDLVQTDEKKKARWPIKGQMTFNYGVTQNVDVFQTEIPKPDSK